MMLPEQWAYVAQERMNDFQKEARRQQLLVALPTQPSHWRQWTGSAMVWSGTWLLRWGERLAQCKCREESVSLAS